MDVHHLKRPLSRMSSLSQKILIISVGYKLFEALSVIAKKAILPGKLDKTPVCQ